MADCGSRSMAELKLSGGEPLPLGATWTGEGVNFAVFSSTAERIELCVFDPAGERELGRVDLPAHTAGVWHGFLPPPLGAPGLVYGFRVHGPYEPARGLRHNPAKLLIDPYARALTGQLQWDDALYGYEGAETDDRASGRDSAPFVPKSTVIDSRFDWGDDRPPSIPWRDSVIYELHVKGFTKLHPAIPEQLRGTYLGLAHPAAIDYLKNLGVTAVELLPVQAFISERFLIEKGLKNYWGYNSIAWCAPARDYAVADPVVEFKTMVRALHRAGIEVILDVVFNHSAEGSELGPTLDLRGLDNAAYYALDTTQPRRYWNRSGCGNTIAVSHPATRQLIIDSLCYWVQEMHIDGFRFDLAPVLGRDAAGYFRFDSAFFQTLAAEPAFNYTKLIAEPWDIGPGGYQLGHFPPGWAEWNDLYRDTLRGFWRSNPGVLGAFAERFAGSSDLFRGSGRRPTAGINYLTCHDGFTLYDWASYNDKHNDANLEDNRDGHNHNLSWNCGVEGATDDPQILELRFRQLRNMFVTLLFSQGVPMLLAGDEFARSQRGNNNAYCQDNEINWLNWSLERENIALVEFVRQLIGIRRRFPGLRRDTFLKGARGPDREHKDISWRHPEGREFTAADWHDAGARAIGVLIGQAFSDPRDAGQGHLLLLCNASDQTVTFVLPQPRRDIEWRLTFDTARNHPALIAAEPAVRESYSLEPHSAALLTDGLPERRLTTRAAAS